MRTLALLSVFCCTTLARAEEPLTVDDAVRIARQNHPTVGANRAQVEAQHARLHEARSGITPGVSGSITYNPQTANFAPTPGFVRALVGRAGSFATLADGTRVSCAPDAAGNFSPTCMANPMQQQLPADYTLFNYW